MRKPSEIIINGITLEEILRNHKKWLKNSNNGVRADLSNADLTNANLINADLRVANLRGANLSGADLNGAKLLNADLSNADLSDADLSNADLSDANLINADLRRADLDLSQLNLSCKGLNFTIDERLAKQIAYHLINLMQHSKIAMPDNLIDWANTSHLVNGYKLPKLGD